MLSTLLCSACGCESMETSSFASPPPSLFFLFFFNLSPPSLFPLLLLLHSPTELAAQLSLRETLGNNTGSSTGWLSGEEAYFLEPCPSQKGGEEKRCSNPAALSEHGKNGAISLKALPRCKPLAPGRDILGLYALVNRF